MKRILAVLVLICVLCGCLAGFAACKSSKRPDNVIYVKSMYFGEWEDFNDDYTKFIENKFGVKFTDSKSGVSPAAYDFDNWTKELNSDLAGYNQGKLPDVFEADIDSLNFYDNYIKLAQKGRIKALPDSVLDENGEYPYLAKMLNNYSDLPYLKYKGKLYGIPIARNIEQTDVPFAPFTYIYRRDIAEKLGVAKENDEYTWSDFVKLLAAFKQNDFKKYGALGDSEWAYPSIANFYKPASHCFAIEGNQVVNNYTTRGYLDGLNKTKELKQYYLTQQGVYAGGENRVKDTYLKSQIGVFYENITMANYKKIQKEMGGNGDKYAIMKVRGEEDGKYVLEEQEQWFSMSLISGQVSDKKLKSILAIMNWLLSPEGTRMALYGIKGQDYTMDEAGNVTLLNKYGSLWYMSKGAYTDYAYNNGARFLRYMVTLGNDLIDKDPLIQNDKKTKEAYDTLQAWTSEMMDAYKHSELRILGEDTQVKWMQTTYKQEYLSGMQNKAKSFVLDYAFYGNIKTESDYKKSFSNDTWKKVLDEINANYKPASN